MVFEETDPDDGSRPTLLKRPRAPLDWECHQDVRGYMTAMKGEAF